MKRDDASVLAVQRQRDTAGMRRKIRRALREAKGELQKHLDENNTSSVTSSCSECRYRQGVIEGVEQVLVLAGGRA